MTNAQSSHLNLEQNYRQNLLFFREKNPSLAKKIEKYQDPKFSLAVDQNNQLNIWCQSKWFYDCSPSLFYKNQIKKSLTSPEYLQLTVKDTNTPHEKIKKYRYLHQFYLEKLRTIPMEKKIEKSDMYCPTLLFLGTGLGQHLKEIISKTQCNVAFIFEPVFDIFYASLFTFSYNSIEKELIFCIDESWQTLANEIANYFLPLRMHNASKIHIIQHYAGHKIIEAKNQIANSYGRLFDGAGFLEDESLGINQFILNTKNTFRLLSRPHSSGTHTSHLANPSLPALIVGSGPSIDNDLDKIKKNRHKFIIFSCSSSIDIMHAMGVIPDFHCENERVDAMVRYLGDFKDKEYLKKITLLTLSPCHPGIRALL